MLHDYLMVWGFTLDDGPRLTIYSFISQKFNENLLCAEQCSRRIGINSLCPHGADLKVEETQEGE